MKIVYSVEGIPIRLSAERYHHICSRHPEMEGQEEKILETVSNPQYIQKGDFGEKLSVRFYQETPMREKYLVVVYKEEEKEGFILTAYFTRKPAQWREVLWRQ